MSPSRLVRATSTLKALAHPARLRVLALLRSGSLCVCQVAATLGLPVSSVSERAVERRKRWGPASA
jgi:ArsR family transcriptional regulator